MCRMRLLCLWSLVFALEMWHGCNVDFFNDISSLQVFDIGRYQESLAAYFALGQHQHINQILEILLGDTRAYVFFERSYGDMHSFVRTCKKLREDEAARLFYQIASAVAHCHDNGLVLRDLKLRKFVFKREDRWVHWNYNLFPCLSSKFWQQILICSVIFQTDDKCYPSVCLCVWGLWVRELQLWCSCCKNSWR